MVSGFDFPLNQSIEYSIYIERIIPQWKVPRQCHAAIAAIAAIATTDATGRQVRGLVKCKTNLRSI